MAPATCLSQVMLVVAFLPFATSGDIDGRRLWLALHARYRPDRARVRAAHRRRAVDPRRAGGAPHAARALSGVWPAGHEVVRRRCSTGTRSAAQTMRAYPSPLGLMPFRRVVEICACVECRDLGRGPPDERLVACASNGGAIGARAALGRIDHGRPTRSAPRDFVGLEARTLPERPGTQHAGART